MWALCVILALTLLLLCVKLLGLELLPTLLRFRVLRFRVLGHQDGAADRLRAQRAVNSLKHRLPWDGHVREGLGESAVRSLKVGAVGVW